MVGKSESPSLIIILIDVVSEPIYAANINSVVGDYIISMVESVYVRNLDLCGNVYAMLEHYSLLIFGGAVLQWAVVATAGHEVLELKAMG